MKYLVSILLCMAMIACFGEKPEVPKGLEECKKLKEEFKNKIYDINQKAKEARHKIKKAWKEGKKECWKENRGDIDALKSCISEKKQKALSKLDEIKSIVTKRFDDILVVIDSYSAKFKECKAKRDEFKELKEVGKFKGRGKFKGKSEK